MDILGAIGVGLVTGWLIPVVRRVSPRAVIGTIVAAMVTAATIWLLAGVPPAIAVSTAMAIAALFHGALLAAIARQAPGPRR